MKPQTRAILTHLETGQPITPLIALKRYGCFRLGARIYELKQLGYAVHGMTVKDAKTGKWFSMYRLQMMEARK